MADIQAVLFDVGSTLIEPNPPVERVFHETALRRGHDVPFETVQGFMGEVNEFYEREYVKNGDFWASVEGSRQIWLDMYRYLSHLTGLEADSEGIAQEIHSSYTQADYWAAYEDVRPTLMALKKDHYRLAVVSNWGPDLRGILRGMGLAPFFDEIVCSAEVGYRKPNPMIFNVAVDHLGVDASRIVHVGDLPEADGEGASSAGILPVIIDRNGDWDGCGYHRMQMLTELPSLLKGL